jgi:hypothetical protein
MHLEAYNAVGDMLRVAGVNTEQPWQALDVGGASWNGSARPHLPNANWTVLDLAPTQYEDDSWSEYVVADATKWIPEENGFKRFDVVTCTELLEHVQDWPAVCRTLAHCVTETGTVVITCASTSRPVHGATGAPLPAEGEWYGNVDVPDLEFELLKWFSYVRTDYRYPPGDAYALARFPR